VSAIVASAATYFFLTQFEKDIIEEVYDEEIIEEVEEEVVDVEEEQEAIVYYAIENEMQLPEPSNPDNMMVEYVISSYSSATNEESELITVQADYFNERFEMEGEAIYFISVNGELGRYDLEANQAEVVTLEGIAATEMYPNEATIRDFEIDGDEILYLAGDCTEQTSCTLYKGSIDDGSGEVVLQDIFSLVDEAYMAGINIKDFDSENDSVVLTVSAGDACWYQVELYEVNLVDQGIEKTEEVVNDCFGNEGEVITDEEQVIIDKLTRIHLMDDRMCGNLMISESRVEGKRVLNIEKDGELDEIEGAYFAGCKE